MSDNPVRQKLAELKELARGSRLDLSREIADLERKLEQSLSPENEAWRRVELARHGERPTTLDYARAMFDEFLELHGDRTFADDPAMVGGIGTLAGRAVTFVGHQQGRNGGVQDTVDPLLKGQQQGQGEGGIPQEEQIEEKERHAAEQPEQGVEQDDVLGAAQRGPHEPRLEQEYQQCPGMVPEEQRRAAGQGGGQHPAPPAAAEQGHHDKDRPEIEI